jgi:hypothetical protein
VTASLRRLYRPEPVAVHTGAEGVPVEVGAVAVESLRERWLVDDRWWTPRAWLHREYFELVLVDGSSLVVFQDLRRQRWFRQRV